MNSFTPAVVVFKHCLRIQRLLQMSSKFKYVFVRETMNGRSPGQGIGIQCWYIDGYVTVIPECRTKILTVKHYSYTAWFTYVLATSFLVLIIILLYVPGIRKPSQLETQSWSSGTPGSGDAVLHTTTGIASTFVESLVRR